MLKKELKLHLGCGTKKLDGWVNIDSVKSCHPDLLHDFSRTLPYADQSVAAILAEDLLEHFDKYMRFVVFYDWARVLKIGGIMTLQVPNFKKMLFKYFKFGFNNFVDVVFGETLWQSRMYLGHFGSHKWGYSVDSLREFIALFGMEATEVTTKGLNIRLSGKKIKHVSQDAIDRYSIYSHANCCGNGEASVSVKLVREKIMEFLAEGGDRREKI